jgi:hypothetical protein
MCSSKNQQAHQQRKQNSLSLCTSDVTIWKVHQCVSCLRFAVSAQDQQDFGVVYHGNNDDDRHIQQYQHHRFCVILITSDTADTMSFGYLFRRCCLKKASWSQWQLVKVIAVVCLVLILPCCCVL